VSDDKPATVLAARMSSIERKGPAVMPREMEIRAMWGNVQLDLRESTFEPGTSTLNVHVTMGNVELVVPPHLRVEMEASSFAANIESEQGPEPTKPPEGESPLRIDGRHVAALHRGDPVLKIVGRVRFGNVEIHRMWPGETQMERVWRKRRERFERHGHRAGDGHGHGHGHGNEEGHGPGHGRWHSRWHDRHGDACDPFEDDPRAKNDGDAEPEGDGWRARRARRRRRWRELHAERDLWRKNRGRGQAWVPWWLMSRMRRRIFLWLAVALGGGIAIGLRVGETPRWWWVAIGLVVLSMVSGAIAFRLTRPLIMVVKAARDIGDGRLDTRLDVDRHGGETRVLASAINDMAEKIEQQMSDQKQLLAAVSHELRTPLGHMRVLVETARSDLSGADKTLAEIDREIVVLDDLVGKLLASSRLEFGNLERRELELGELTSDAAIGAGVAPEMIEVNGDVRVAGDPTLIRRAIANLLDNARVHGKGAIAVRVERRAGLIAIEVDDAGPGVPEERRLEAFRAFGPSTASAAQGGSGLGLGLALVSRIAVAHGGGAWIAERPGGGARVGFSIGALSHHPGPLDSGSSELDPAVAEREEHRD
jgi:signal transduction histidine kinase